jgi:signal transduction histidine kinase
MKRLRTLYAKIFIWFWFTVTVGSLLVLAITVITGSRPMGRRWMRMTQDLYAHTAVDFYETGGKPALKKYLDVLASSSGMDASLLDEQQHDVLGRPLPAHVEGVLKTSMNTGQSTYNLGASWTAASPVQYLDRRFIFVIEAHPMQGFIPFDGTFLIPILARLALALLIAGILCLMLARHIVAPVRALQSAALRLAAGDLHTRVMPAMAHREDELADTAKAFDQMADRIQSLLQKRQELLADISHELRSPLTRISVSPELLRRGETDVLEQMQLDLDRMNEMIAQVLLLARLDVQAGEPARERVDLASMIEGIAQDAGFEGQNANKTLAVRVSNPCFVSGDSNLLRSCIENVVRNAVRHTAPATAVEIAVCNVMGVSRVAMWEISVADRGPGVPEASLPFLFDPFYRVSESRVRNEGGTGLGLSISQRVASLHRGSIQAENRSEVSGLLVRIYLPALLTESLVP